MSVPPLYLRCWPKDRHRAPGAVLSRPAHGQMRNDRDHPLRWNLAVTRYVENIDRPSWPDLLEALGWDAEAGDFDLGDCPYYARYHGLTTLPGYNPDGICAYGCREEPDCVTCEPEGGWPSVHAALSALQPPKV